jgi:tetratricopeptide (TPR) repeat protein
MAGAVRGRFVAAALVVALAAGQAQAEDSAAAAASAYKRGLELQAHDPAAAQEQFRQAARHYEQLAAGGHQNSRLFYNLGHAYLQAGDLGRAVLSYRRAERLDPSDPRPQEALAHVRRLLPGCTAPPAPAWQRAVTASAWLSPAWRVWLGAVGYLFGWLLLVAAWWRSRRWLAFAGTPLLLAGLCVLGSAAWQFQQDALYPRGVVCDQAVVLREGNGASFRPVRADPLPPGAEFRTLAENNGWLRVRLPDGTKGWLPREYAILDR